MIKFNLDKTLKIGCLVFYFLMVGAIASCQYQGEQSSEETISPSSDSNGCRIIEHEMGEVEICGQPERIIALGPYFLEPLLALNTQPIGFADHFAFHSMDYDNPTEEIPYLGSYITQPLVNVGTASTPSIEAILKAQPDLIIGSQANASQYQNLAAIAPTVLLEYEETTENLKTIASAINRSEQASKLLSQSTQRLATAKESFASLVATHPRIALIRSSNLKEIRSANSSGICRSLLEEVGFEMVFLPGMSSDDSNANEPFSLESLPQLNDADLVILLGRNMSGFKQAQNTNRFEEHQLSALKQAWEENAITQSLDASKAGRVYYIPDYLCLGLPGPIGTELYLEELREQLLSHPIP